MEAGQHEIGKVLDGSNKADDQPMKSEPTILEKFKEKEFKVLEWDGINAMVEDEGAPSSEVSERTAEQEKAHHEMRKEAQVKLQRIQESLQ
ncbi:hypothetical protein PHLCEN_2v7067 [Hermanssonia centrifuga]|uniref:Uncharacterized protein n=1 Tax=Hermanssonia centrifuga TaxID=98765 RepID=A0A2R6NXK7_9APHY|nr:hypothetical protein PHLCEN_2v7067 [Hermanssonia centrifuga]